MERIVKRIGWIDICKALAIYCMVLGHTGTYEKVSIVIHAFHMPVFFLLSGYCFNEINNSVLGELIKKRLKTLIIPYFVFGAGLFLFWDAALYVMHRQSEMRSIMNLLTSILWNNANASAFGVIQWFLPCLFFAEIIFAALVKITGNNQILIGGGITVLSIVAYVIPLMTKVRLPLAFDCALMASAFYGLGWMMKKGRLIDYVAETIKKHKVVSLVIVIFIAVAAIPLISLNGAVNMRTVTYGNYFLYIINALIYSLVLIAVSMMIDCVEAGNWIVRFLEWIGRNTLIVLMLNSTGVRVYEVVFGNVIEKFSPAIVNGINAVAAILITIVCVIASEIINRYLPWLVGRSKSKRN